MKKIKTLISWAIGIPAALIFCSEAEPDFLWAQIAAIIALVGILAWNGATAFNKEAA